MRQPGESPPAAPRSRRDGEKRVRMGGEEKREKRVGGGGGGGTKRLRRHSVCHTDHTHQGSAASIFQLHPATVSL